ncbi:PLP-dependent aminotransferase family protein [Embleya sp. AB8]|uniref:MocR-like pyridoxine biosynthesis transcription factor PdxR n=1 Tax=Embleya sp. AB8 TaxID=3156304 RepID=UPI003C77C1CC
MSKSKVNSEAGTEADPGVDAGVGAGVGVGVAAGSEVGAAEWSGRDLHLELAGTGSRRAGLIRAIREAIRTGRLAPDTPLPPYRSLAADLGIARNTVADAYAELVAEGWLTARQGSGTRVARRAAPVAAPRPRTPARRAAGPVYDLRQGQPDAASFPRAAWVASARRALTAAPSEAFGPGDPRGRPELRVALTEYLARVRGVRTHPDRIVVCSGYAHALRLLFGGGVLRGPAAVESYGLAFHRSILATASIRTLPLAVDEHGADPGESTALSGARVALLTPAHQFPTGVPLAPERRVTALDWARARGGIVVEDDYDGEFRYDRRPVGAVQGMDPDRVVYIDSVSKSLSPAIRLGWMVLPDHLVEDVLTAKGLREAWAGVTDQLTLADFIEGGHYDRHIRRMRQRYRARRDHLVTALAEHVPEATATGIAAGLHAVLRLPAGTEAKSVEAAKREGLALDALSTFRHPDAAGAAEDGLVVGYATPPDHAYPAALAALCRALRAALDG